MKKILHFLWFVFLALPAFAGDTAGRMPTQPQIEEQMRANEAERARIFGSTPLPRGTHNFQSINPKPSTVNVEDVARKYTAITERKKIDGVFVFVSFSMKSETLQKLAADARKVGGSLIFRGFKNDSWKDTSAAIRGFNLSGASAQVNPNLYKQFKITRVPAFVLVKSNAMTSLDENGCSLDADFIGVYGDVSLRYAIENIRDSSPPDFAQQAGRLLLSLSN